MIRICCLLVTGAMAAWAQADKLAGTWVRTAGGESYRLELKADGNALLNGSPLRWSYAGGKLTLAGREAAVEVTDTTLTLAGGIVFQREAANTDAAAGCRGLVGTWRGPDMTVTLGADGRTVIGGVQYQYAADAGVITLTGADGTFRFPYELSGGVLNVTINGARVALTCSAGGFSSADLVGKWCALSNFNANNGGRMSSSCVVLRADGTYEYNAETSSSGPVASQVTQEWDRGTWTATASTLTGRSQTRGTTTTYTLEKRNHPKTRDPMIILNGQAFVTYGPRAPW